MINIRNLIQNKNGHTNAGQGLTEYAIILALVGISVIFVTALLSPTIENVFSTLVAEAEVAPPALLAYTPPPTLPPSPTIDPNVTATTPAPTATSAPPTATNTSGPATATNTIAPPTATNTAAPPTATNTSAPPTATNTAAPPTATNTSAPPTATNTSIPPTATLAPSLELYLEAESGSGLGSWNVPSDGSASSGQYIVWNSGTSNSSPPSSDQVTYSFTAPSEGLYQIHLRVDTNNSGGDDSVWVKVDGADLTQSQNITRSDGWVKFNGMVHVSSWTWDQVHNIDISKALVEFYLPAGTHTLRFAYRETGTQIDQIFISNTGASPSTASTPTPVPPTPTNTPIPPTPTNTPVPPACTVYNSTDVPQTITSSGSPTINSVLNISGSSGTINDINVLNLNGQHTWINDLDFNLASPSSTSVQIMARSCYNQDDFNLNLDDEAAPGSWPCPPTGGGTYQPSNSLSAFDGQNANGTWTLTINDNANYDGGSLDGWSLEVCTGS